MFDVHSHILPGIDDGSPDLSVSLAMARLAVAGGVTVQACTPHILPGVYNNRGEAIRAAVAALQAEFDREEIGLRLVPGADVHLMPGLVEGLQSGRVLSLADSRYVLVEPPDRVPPARLADQFFGLMLEGYHPILTHPERLGWVSSHYALIEHLAQAGVWMQVTASSLTGGFGRRAQYWAERMMDEGKVHLIASDAHDARRRPPDLLQGREAAAKRVGDGEATHMVVTRPLCILANDVPSSVPDPCVAGANAELSNEKLASPPPRPPSPGPVSDARSGEGGNAGAGLRSFFDGVRRLFRHRD
ncbi:tyrosine-protein phosphatase [Labrys monachus]|uniref:protein-tyrosine-phosphatase n=1 Tax=Labrys monachus TaxID=217067 RepID=A0ABU0F7T0_9HYPH|nr:CpsB/CapC family capsule biosynthesis tyrosine phosphatase [Labrys monachus]MDQ0390668.1 protein-tyrosine phosphatase [Labrys monachus]